MNPLSEDVRFLTRRALWETENLIACVPDALWDRRYDGLPMWKYLFHTLYSMDRWFIDPNDPDYRDPDPRAPRRADLNDVPPAGESVSRAEIALYFAAIREKLEQYVSALEDGMLSECPPGCGMTRFRLILGQFRHWHRHMGIRVRVFGGGHREVAVRPQHGRGVSGNADAELL